MADSGGGALVRPVAFEEVDAAHFLQTHLPQVCRGANFVAWSEATTAGIFATGTQTLADLHISQGFCRRQLVEGPPRALLIDARDFGVDALSLDNLLHASPLQGAREASNVVRISVILPLGWSRAFWLGAIALGVRQGCPVGERRQLRPLTEGPPLRGGQGPRDRRLGHLELRGDRSVREATGGELEDAFEASSAARRHGPL